MMARIIDAHHHFWKTAAQDQPWRSEAHAALEHDFEPDALIPELDRAGVDATVVMQSVDERPENDRLARYAMHERVAGIVAWLPIRDVNSARTELDRLSIAKLCGVRCLVADDPLEWLNNSQSIGLFREIAARGLSWDVVPITIEQTQQLIKLAQAVPELKIVIDHLGRPPLDTGGWEPWATHVKELARYPGVAMKISVGIDALTAWDSWNAHVLDPYVAHACEHFGSGRLMIASNWPVILLRTSYQQAWQDLVALVTKHVRTIEGRADVFGRSAERWYRLRSPHISSGEVTTAAPESS